jgi:hypothetical protein
MCTTEEQAAKGLNANDSHQEIFLVYGGMCLLRKAVNKWV